MHLKHPHWSVLSGIAAALLVPRLCLAEDCSMLEENVRWNELFTQFNTQYSEGDYAGAIETTKLLQEICSKSPILNFSIAGSYNKLGDNANAKKYIRFALEQTEEFAVSPEVLESMWLMRFEIEACDREEYDKLAAKEAEERQQLEDTTHALMVANEELQKRREVMAGDVSEEHLRNQILMWSGVGVGGAGLIMMITGAALAGIERGEKTVPNDSFESDKSGGVTVKSHHYATWTLLGIGIGATIAGAAMAGLGAYYYTHPITEDMTMTVAFSPSYLNFGVAF
jgi:hypothetical protein